MKGLTITSTVILFTIIFQSCSKESDYFELYCQSESKVLFISRRIPESAEWRIYLMNCDGTDQRTLSDKLVRCSRPVVSSDGKMIAFTTYEDKTYHLYIIEKDGLGLTLLSKGKQYCGSPSFSPDNSKILFCKRDSFPDNTTDIHMIDTKGTNEIRITSTGDNSSPSWYPLGERILFSSLQDDIYGIYSMNADGSDKQLLSPENLSFCCPRISPDGSRIVMVQPSFSGLQIYVMNINGKDLKQLTFTVSPDHFDSGFPRDANSDPNWSPNSQKIAYVSWEDGDPDIFVIDPDGSNNKRLTNSSKRDESPYWTSDGNYLLFTSGRNADMSAEIFVMRQDGAEQTALSKYKQDDIYPVWLD
jgi:TolB protein